MKTRILTAAALAIALTLSVHAQVPGIINYQGRIVDNGTNFDGTGLFGFALVNPGGTTNYWSNDGTSAGQPALALSLTVTKGLYSVLLGDTTVSNMTMAVPVAVFTNANVLLRVWFNDGVNGVQQLGPDQRIAAVGYALMAGSVPDGSITAAKIATGAVGSNQIAVGAIGSAAIAAGAVTAANIGSGQVVKSVNGLTDAVTLSAGSNITVTPIGNGLQIAATGGGGITSINGQTASGITLSNKTTTGLNVTNAGSSEIDLSGVVSNLQDNAGQINMALGTAGVNGNSTLTFNTSGGDLHLWIDTNDAAQAFVVQGFIEGSIATVRFNPSGSPGGEYKALIAGGSGLTAPPYAIMGVGESDGSGNLEEGYALQSYQNRVWAGYLLGRPTVALGGNSSFSFFGEGASPSFYVLSPKGPAGLFASSGIGMEHANDSNFVYYMEESGVPGTGVGTNLNIGGGFNATLGTNADNELNHGGHGFNRYINAYELFISSNGIGYAVARELQNGTNSQTTGRATPVSVTNQFNPGGIVFPVRFGDIGTAQSNDTFSTVRVEDGTERGYTVSSNFTVRILGGTGNTNITGNAAAMVYVTNVISAVNSTFTLGRDRGFVSISAVLGTGASASLMYINGTTTNPISSFGIPGTNTFCGHADAGSTLLFTNWTGASVIVLNDGSYSPNRVTYP